MELPRNVTPNAPPEPGIVASSVYSAGRRVADIPIEEAGDWAGQGRPCRLDRPARARPRAAVAGPGAIPAARSGDRGCRAPAPAAEARAVRRCAVHRRPHGAADRGPRHLRRDASLRRHRLHRQRPARPLDLLYGGAPALGELPAGAGQGRGLHPLCDPRFHRRQLHAGARDDRGRGRRDRGPGAAEADDRGRHRAALHAAPRSAAAAQRRRCRWSRSAAG